MDTLQVPYRWIILALTIANQAVSLGIAVYSFALFSIPWLDEYSVSRSQLMLAIFIFQIMSGLASPFIGQKLDTLSLRWPIVIGFLFFGSGLCLLAAANAYWQIISVYAILFSISLVLIGPLVSQLLISRWFMKNRGFALGISATGASLGGVVFPPLIAVGLSAFTLSSVMLYLSIFCLVVMIPINYLLLGVSPPGLASDGADKGGIIPLPWTTKRILSAAAFWIPLTVLIPVNAAFSSVQFNMGVYLRDLSYPATFAGHIIAISSLFMFFGKLMYGKLSDQVDHRYLLLFVALMNISMLALLSTNPDKLLLYVAAMLLGISSGGMMPLMGAVFVSRFGVSSFGKVMGLVMLFLVMGGFGTVYTGWLYDVLDTYNYAFISLIVLMLPGIALLKWLPPPALQYQRHCQ